MIADEADSDGRINILLVDDNVANLQALEALLESPDYRLVRATSGEQALGLLLDMDFAVILMDVMMPVMDGFETARLIRQREHSAHIPIIFLTAIAKDKRYQELGYESGAVDYLTKPVDGFALRSKLAVFADLQRVRNALRKEIARREQLESESVAEHEHQIQRASREQTVLDRFTTRQTTSVTAALHGEKLLRDADADIFAGLVDRYSHMLDMAIDSRVHKTDHDLAPEFETVAAQLAFMGAGPRDVVDVHKEAIAKACEGRPQAKVRLVTEEGRFLLVELMGYLLAIYRRNHNRHMVTMKLTPQPSRTNFQTK